MLFRYADNFGESDRRIIHSGEWQGMGFRRMTHVGEWHVGELQVVSANGSRRGSRHGGYVSDLSANGVGPVSDLSDLCRRWESMFIMYVYEYWRGDRLIPITLDEAQQGTLNATLKYLQLL